MLGGVSLTRSNRTQYMVDANISVAMNEMLFELYSVPKVAYGVDSLFSFYYNDGNSGLVVSSGYTSTTLIPIVDRKPLFNYASRLNWGRSQNAEFLKKLLALKYPAFGSKPTDPQLEDLVREHCYVAQDYQEELNHYLDWSGSEDRDHIVQWPFTETIIPQKTEEELAAAAEKRRLNGVRLQEQAAKMRLEKLVRKEQELEYYKDLQQRIAGMTKKDARLMLESDDFDDEGQLHKRTKELEKSIRKARNRDVGDLEEEPEEVVTYPLLETPDADLDEDGLKQKRLQRLMKANADARARAKAEKEVERLRKAEEERIDTERRTNDFEAWIGERRIARQMILQKIKDRDRLKAQLGDRKSLATQLRMKSIANLASDNPSKKRRRGGDDDTFGADDADWSVYRQIAMGEQSDDEEEQEDLNTSLKNIEKQLLQHDPTFNEDSTREAQSDWTKSLVHTFLRGPWPHDPESQREQHQMHLNVERIRVPEVVFQPSIAGLDQAGIVEIAGGLLTQSLQDESQRGSILEDIFLTSGNTLFQGFEARLRHDLRSLLPAEAPMKVRSAKDPIMDAWRGAAKWASSANAKMTYVTAAEYADQGADYMKVFAVSNISDVGFADERYRNMILATWHPRQILVTKD